MTGTGTDGVESHRKSKANGGCNQKMFDCNMIRIHTHTNTCMYIYIVFYLTSYLKVTLSVAEMAWKHGSQPFDGVIISECSVAPTLDPQASGKPDAINVINLALVAWFTPPFFLVYIGVGLNYDWVCHLLPILEFSFDAYDR